MTSRRSTIAADITAPCPVCSRNPVNGEKWLGCCDCATWYHTACAENLDESQTTWRCTVCSDKRKNCNICHDQQTESLRFECSVCHHNIHLTCAGISQSDVDEAWICVKCQPPVTCIKCREPFESAEKVLTCSDCKRHQHPECATETELNDDKVWVCEPCQGKKETVSLNEYLEVSEALEKVSTLLEERTKTTLQVVEERNAFVKEKNALADENAKQAEIIRNLQERLEVKDRYLGTPLPAAKKIPPKTRSESARELTKARMAKLTKLEKDDKELEDKISVYDGEEDRKSQASIASSAGKEGKKTSEKLKPATDDYPVNKNPSKPVPPKIETGKQEASKPVRSEPGQSELMPLDKLVLQHGLQPLPKFSGNFKDWPIFIAAYNRSVARVPMNEETKLDRLEVALTGEARAEVIGSLPFAEKADEIIEMLKEKYGRVDETVKSLTEELVRLPVIPNNNRGQMEKFATGLRTYALQMKAMGQVKEVNNSFVLSQLADKLAKNLALHAKWKEMVRQKPGLSIIDMADFLKEKCRNMPAAATQEEVKKDISKGALPRMRNAHTIEAAANPVMYVQPRGCVYCGTNADHPLYKCPHFLKLTPEGRYEEVKKKRMCFICLCDDHLSPKCKMLFRCKKDGCGGSHNTLLHLPKAKVNIQQQVAPLNQNARPYVPNAERQVNLHHRYTTSGDFSVTAKVIAVRIHGKDGQYVDTFAFLDDGSQLTMMERSIAERLGLDGPEESLLMSWTGGVTRREEAMKCDIILGGLQAKGKFELDGVYCVKGLDLATMGQNGQELATRFKHLRGLPLPDFAPVKPEVLIGLSHANFLNGNRTIEGQIGQPVATKTKLGWVVYGRQNLTDPSSPSIQCHQLRTTFHNTHMRLAPEDESLHDLVKSFFTTENYGVEAKQLKSQEDERAEQIMEATLRKIEGRYEIGLLWRDDEARLPDSLPMARKRLEAEERKLRKDPDTLKWMNEHVENLLIKGYARKASERDLNTDWPRIWYVPMFIVVNHNKVPPKRRVVADAAATTSREGPSLNTFLLKGPDHLISLTTALCRVREHEFMVNMDVETMFHQVRITQVDQQCQRFLWRNGEQQREPEVYIMQSMMFGPSCSPSEAQYVKNEHAKKYTGTKPEAAEALQKYTYADDYFNSHATIEEAVRVTKDAIEICAAMGFSLVQGQSNSSEVLKQLPENRVKAELISLNMEEASVYSTKILGMFWQPEEDILRFKRSNVKGEKASNPTKREMLSMLMRVFDPLGLAAKFIIQGKIIMQEVWREATAWDEPVSDELASLWSRFLTSFDELANVKIPRRYAPVDPTDSEITLVVFVDASESAYAAACYLRFERQGEVFVTLSMAKTKVAPLKQLSIPRLELLAALLGARLAKTVEASHSFKLKDRFFLSDSTCVLAWIRRPTSRLNAFVSHRITEISELTRTDEWYKVPTALNVADDATKDNSGRGGEFDKRWLRGPEFMKSPIAEWPVKSAKEVAIEGDALGNFVGAHLADITTQADHFVKRIGAKYRSSWTQLTRIVAWIMRVMQKRPGGPYITCAERAEAEAVIFAAIQQESFAVEWAELHKWAADGSTEAFDRSRLRKGSSLSNLPLTMRKKENVIRLEARDRKSSRAYGAKNPVLLPSRHELVEVFVRHHHEMNQHIGIETTIADIREKAWIIGARETLRRVTADCGWCKKQKLSPIMPPKAGLHEARMMFAEKPFSFVGVDCFGPIDVKMGRGTIKRWGVIFTCLTFRAVRLEVAEDMTSDQILRAVRRLMVIRGHIQRLYSDQGTNFVGADNILKGENRRQQLILGEKAARDLNVDWSFNPSYSPWMGGAWERLIGYIKKSLMFTLGDATPTDGMLRDALSEAELLVNKRPLTHTPISADDAEPLTPNMVLIGANDSPQAMGEYEERDFCSRLARNRVRHLTEKFRGRWEKEYLPKITEADARHARGRPVQVGDLVYMTENTSKRSEWRLGRIVKIHPSQDGVPRIVDVKLGNGDMKLKKAVGNLAVLAEKSSAPDGTCDGGNVS